MKNFKNCLLLILFILPLSLMAQDHVGSWKIMVPNGEGGTMLMKVTMNADNTYHIDAGADGSVEIKGKYSISGDKVTIQDTEGTDCSAKGVYTLKVSGNQLTMTMVSDACEGRGNPDGPMVMTRM